MKNLPANRPESHQEAKREKTDRLETLGAALKGLMDRKFTGYIKLNFSQGSIGRVEKFEEILG